MDVVDGLWRPGSSCNIYVSSCTVDNFPALKK
jgi:hypothetical protein